MRRFSLPALAAALAATTLAATAFPTLARPLTAPEAKSLDGAVSGYLRAIETGDAKMIVGAIPPRIIQLFAAQSGTDAATLEKTLAEQTQSLLGSSRFSELRAATGGADATESSLADGTGVVWAVIPTEFTVTQGEASTRNKQPMLALRESDAWYFIRIEGAAQSQMISLAYPFLADAKFPASTSTPTK